MKCGLVNAVCDVADAESTASPEAAVQLMSRRVHKPNFMDDIT